MATVSAAYPFIDVIIDTSALQPVAQRSPGVIAVVGTTPSGASGGEAPVNVPQVVDTLDQAASLFASSNRDGTVNSTPLYDSLAVAMLQDPRPSKIYGVRADGQDYAAALVGLEAVEDVTFVALANETNVGTASGDDPATGLMALKEHVENMSAQAQRRIGVAMLDPTTSRSPSYVDDTTTAVAPLKSSISRMIMIGARGADGDAASAAMAAIAGHQPHISVVLKRVRGVTVPRASQYGPSEIKGLSEAEIVPLIDPDLIVGDSLHFAEGRCFTSDASLLYIDIVRTLDDIEFRLKAGLIGMIGDARITKSGMTRVATRVEGILGPLRRSGVIDAFDIDIPVLSVLNLPEGARTATDNAIVQTARANRAVDMFVTVTYGPAVHRLRVTLAPKF